MATENPYAAPEAQVADAAPTLVDTPEEIIKKIRHAWVAALVSGTVTLIAVVLSVSGTPVLGYTAWEFIDAAFIFGLAFGIYKKSRTCALIILVYFIASKINIMVETGKPSGLIMGLLFAYFFWEGVTGTFAYHKHRKKQLDLQEHRG